MMAVDVAEVWVAAQSGMGPMSVIPYVRTVDARTLQYKIEVLKRSATNQSQIAQSGTVQTAAGEAVELSRIAVSRAPKDDCDVKVEISDHGLLVGRYSFTCPLESNAPIDVEKREPETPR
jgi:hypothetical protein